MFKGRNGKNPDTDWLAPGVDIICGNFNLNNNGKIPEPVIEFLKLESGQKIEWVGNFIVLALLCECMKG